MEVLDFHGEENLGLTVSSGFIFAMLLCNLVSP